MAVALRTPLVLAALLLARPHAAPVPKGPDFLTEQAFPKQSPFKIADQDDLSLQTPYLCSTR